MDDPRVDIVAGRSIGPVELGMTPDQVADALRSLACEDFDDSGRPSFDRAFSGSLQVNYDEASRICQSASIYWHPDCGCECYFDGRHVREYSAEELFTLLGNLDGGEHRFEQQSEYQFPHIGMALNDLSEDHDYRDDGARLCYGEIIVERSRNHGD